VTSNNDSIDKPTSSCYPTRGTIRFTQLTSGSLIRQTENLLSETKMPVSKTQFSIENVTSDSERSSTLSNDIPLTKKCYAMPEIFSKIELGMGKYS